MRMGLYSQMSCSSLIPLSIEVRIRVFWAVVKLDMYSSIVLGLPMMIDLTYVDQFKPSEENGGFASVTSRRTFAASTQYLKLLRILRKVMKRFYPNPDEEAEKRNLLKKFPVNNTAIKEIKEEFKTWREGLIDALGLYEG